MNEVLLSVLFVFINRLLFCLVFHILWSSAEPLVICLYIERKGGARLRKIECLLVCYPEELASLLLLERVNDAHI